MVIATTVARLDTMLATVLNNRAKGSCKVSLEAMEAVVPATIVMLAAFSSDCQKPPGPNKTPSGNLNGFPIFRKHFEGKEFHLLSKVWEQWMSDHHTQHWRAYWTCLQ